jgi:hypothetical protein
MPIINQDQLLPEEKDSGVSQSHSILSGLASGLIEIPKGGFSLALNLYDLGAGTDTALQFENLVDKINPFKEAAEASLAGKMAEALTNLGVPSSLGFKLSSNLAKSAMEAKKAGTYFKLNNKALTEAGNVASEGNKAANLIKFGPAINKLSDAERIKSFAAGAIGAGLSDAAFVGDVKNMGTLGDIFGGPTELDRSEEYDPARELINRVKFGTESALFTGLIAGTGSTISKLRDRNWMSNPDSKLDQFFAPIVYGLRPGGADPAEIFKLKLQKLNNIKGDNYVAKQTIDSIFPDIKDILNSQTSEQRKETLNIFNDLLLSGKPEANEVGVFNFNKINDGIKEQAINKLKEMGGSEKNINNIVDGLEKTRETWNSMFNTIGKDFTPEQFNNFKTIVGDQFKDYLGPTFSIFENKSMIPLLNYKPAQDAINKLKETFRNSALEKGTQLTDEQLNYFVDNLLKGTKNTLKVTNPTLSLPNFMIKNSMADDALKLEKTFLSELPEQNRKVIEEYLGKKNPFETILNGTTKLSEIARRNEMFQEMKKSGIVFEKDNLEEAAKTFGVAIEDLKPVRFNGVKSLEAASTNPLQNLSTREDIAKSLSDVFDPGPNSLFGQMASKVYNNFILLPKFASQTAATVLNPFVQLKQLLSNVSFSTANGIIPKINELSELKSIFANQEKKEFLIRNGLWNTNAFMGDLSNLGKDVGLTKDITGSLNFNNIFDKFFNGASKVKTKAEDLYSGADNIFKGLNFIGEKNRLTQAYEKYGIQKTIQEIEQEAADIVKNTVQNYQMVGDAVKYLRKFPIGSFSSYPSEVIRTGTNIVDRAIYEITHEVKLADGTIVKPLANIGYRRLTGMMATTAILPAAMTAAGQAIYNVSNDELDAIKRFVPNWSKNSTIIPIKDKETGELKYIDFSHFSAYDTLYRPIQGAFNEVALGKNDRRGIMGNFIKGIASSTKDILSPFVSQSIYTQALGDVFNKDGRSDSGKVIYNPEDLAGTKVQKSILHVAESLMPFGAPQWKRLGLSLYPVDSEGRFDKYGNTYELSDELLGVGGFRAIKLDLPKNLGFKVSQFQKDADNARRLFTSETLLGGPVTPEDMVDSYINANRSLYNVKSQLYNDLNAAKTLNMSSQDLSRSTTKLSKNDLSNIDRGIFSPLKISKDVEKLFAQNADRLGIPNTYQEVKPVIDSIRQALSINPLSNGVFPKIPNPFKNLPKPTLGPVSNLPAPPVSATTANSGTMDLHPVVAGQQVNPTTKLTENETALLSPTDQLIRQRQRQQQQIVS